MYLKVGGMAGEDEIKGGTSSARWGLAGKHSWV